MPGRGPAAPGAAGAMAADGGWRHALLALHLACVACLAALTASAPRACGGEDDAPRRLLAYAALGAVAACGAALARRGGPAGGGAGAPRAKGFASPLLGGGGPGAADDAMAAAEAKLAEASARLEEARLRAASDASSGSGAPAVGAASGGGSFAEEAGEGVALVDVEAAEASPPRDSRAGRPSLAHQESVPNRRHHSHSELHREASGTPKYAVSHLRHKAKERKSLVEKTEQLIQSTERFVTTGAAEHHGTSNAWESLEDEASHSKFTSAVPGTVGPAHMKTVKASTLTEDQVPFPTCKSRRCATKTLRVWNPLNRYAWDLLILIFIVAVMLIAPFESAFVVTRGLGDRLRPEHSGLFCTNAVIDLAFVIDILLTLNTAYFNRSKGAWVLDRRLIFLAYAKTWLLADVMSVIPWGLLPVPPSARIFKMMKLVRLLKLLRVLKQPRIMSRIVERRAGNKKYAT